MITRQPIIWATLLYIIGILLGNLFSSIIFLYISIALLATGTIVRKKAHIADALLFSFWLTLGMARVAMDNPQHNNTCYEAVYRKAQEQNHKLKERLQNTGLDSEALSVSTALLLGQKSELSRETRKGYAQSIMSKGIPIMI